MPFVDTTWHSTAHAVSQSVSCCWRSRVFTHVVNQMQVLTFCSWLTYYQAQVILVTSVLTHVTLSTTLLLFSWHVCSHMLRCQPSSVFSLDIWHTCLRTLRRQTKLWIVSWHKRSPMICCEPWIRSNLMLTSMPWTRSNLMLTSMEGKTSGWQDSLLNPANTKYAMEVRYSYVFLTDIFSF